MSHILGNGLSWIHERDIPVDDLAALHAGGGDLSQLVVIQREARGLRIQNDHVPVEGTEMPRGRASRQRFVAIDHILRGTVGNEVLQLPLNGRSAACHAFPYLRESPLYRKKGTSSRREFHDRTSSGMVSD